MPSVPKISPQISDAASEQFKIMRLVVNTPIVNTTIVNTSASSNLFKRCGEEAIRPVPVRECSNEPLGRDEIAVRFRLNRPEGRAAFDEPLYHVLILFPLY